MKNIVFICPEVDQGRNAVCYFGKRLKLPESIGIAVFFSLLPAPFFLLPRGFQARTWKHKKGFVV